MVLSMDRWKGKVAIITGASAGIGAAIAEHLVEAGLKVVGLARRRERIEQLAMKLKGNPGELFAVKCDITNENGILEAFEWVKNNVGPVHILINNAGVFRVCGLTNGSTKFWREVLDTNVLGLCIATREAVKNMKANQIDGHIIHINSMAGHSQSPNNLSHVLNVFPASKFAVTALTETLRQELNSIGSKIKITSISPGLVKTEITTASAIASGYEVSGDTGNLETGVPTLESVDVADAIEYALSTPPHVQSISPGRVETESTTGSVIGSVHKVSGDTGNSNADLPTLQSLDIADAVEYVLSTPPHVQVKNYSEAPVNLYSLAERTEMDTYVPISVSTF